MTARLAPQPPRRWWQRNWRIVLVTLGVVALGDGLWTFSQGGIWPYGQLVTAIAVGTLLVLSWEWLSMQRGNQRRNDGHTDSRPGGDGVNTDSRSHSQPAAAFTPDAPEPVEVAPDGLMKTVQRGRGAGAPHESGFSSTPAIDRLAKLIPTEMMDVPGHAFYTGEAGFSGKSPLYLLGENPGGDGTETVRQQLQNVRSTASPYSAYSTHTWKPAGRIDANVAHLLGRLSRDLTRVPASCLIFSRARSEADLAGGFSRLADICWPFHKMVIESLEVRVVVCFGKKTGAYVRKRFNAHREVDQFVEQNNRGWTSTTHLGSGGIKVVTVTHPSRADWRNPAADVTPLVARALRAN